MVCVDVKPYVSFLPMLSPPHSIHLSLALQIRSRGICYRLPRVRKHGTRWWGGGGGMKRAGNRRTTGAQKKKEVNFDNRSHPSSLDVCKASPPFLLLSSTHGRSAPKRSEALVNEFLLEKPEGVGCVVPHVYRLSETCSR